MDELKREVCDFWNEASCGERLLLDASDKARYLAHMTRRYSLEPFIESFARFDAARDLDTLEIGVGLGADHQRYAQAGARLTGIDLTDRAVEHTRRRFELFGLSSHLRVADAESLPFADDSFDWVYSWGVLHHSPDTPRCVDEVLRVLRPGGTAKVMIYHKHSLVGFMLWVRYALMRLRPALDPSRSSIRSMRNTWKALAQRPTPSLGRGSCSAALIALRSGLCSPTGTCFHPLLASAIEGVCYP